MNKKTKCWTDKLKIGDVISYFHNVNYKRTGKILKFTIDSQELLDNIKKYETNENFHGMIINDKK